MKFAAFLKTGGIFFFFSFLFFACSAGQVSTSTSRNYEGASDESDRSDESDAGTLGEVFGGRSKGAKSTGRMDGVEYLIGQDLALHGIEREDREIPKIRSILESSSSAGSSGVWRPRKSNDIPMVHNAQVDRWVKAFTGPLRKNFSRWLKRASRYGPMIEDILREYRLPRDLIYLAMIESGFNLNAYSRAHAAGPWQFIRSTGKLYGLDAGAYVDERRDLEKATRAAAEHLKDLYKMYDDWYLAFAAYNAGAGAVNRAIRNAGTNDFWKLANTKGKKRIFRQETKDYVPRILAAAYISKNYKKFGFSSSLFEPGLESETVTVPDATDLTVIAECAEVSHEEIKELNPSLVMGITPPGQKFTVNVPRGAADAFRKNYAQVPKDQRVRFVYHRVKKRETLAGIARRYGVSKTQLAQWNGLSARAGTLRSGATLMIPKKGAAFKLKPAPQEEPVLTATPLVATPLVASVPTDSVESVIATLSPEAEEKPAVETTTSGVATGDIATSGVAKTHRVKKGETLGAIARKYGVTVFQLRALNGLGKKGIIKYGQTLKIWEPDKDTTVASLATDEGPVLEKELPSATELLARPLVATSLVAEQEAYGIKQEKSDIPSRYVVQEGDSLWSIAQASGVTVSDLVRFNPALADGETIKPHQKLRLTEEMEPEKVAVKTAAKKGSKVAVTSAVPAVEKAGVIIHRVRRGETLSGLARKYRVSVSQIKKWNGLTRDTLFLNQKIKIHATAPSASGKKVAGL
ncbi:MAG: LysM peptidoglycan-binding domain-containing protein [Deltaproteobacteria bacterium]|nr:LysM peptidoglycan-binding domain-containing protein [Deltaproteobacteria bacterium]